MTREEQISKAVEEIFNNADIAIEDRAKLRMWYSMGAKWADCTMIERAANWLCMNMTSIEYFGINGNIVKPDFIRKFKEAMKGE